MLLALLELSVILGLLTSHTDGQINVAPPAERKQQKQECDIKVSLYKYSKHRQTHCATRGIEAISGIRRK